MWSDSVKYEIIQQDKFISNSLGEKQIQVLTYIYSVSKDSDLPTTVDFCFGAKAIH